jgi:hypothetical protein
MAGEQGGKEGQRPKDEGDAWGTKGGRERVKGVREKVRASADVVVQKKKAVHRLLRPKVLGGVRLQDVAH